MGWATGIAAPHGVGWTRSGTAVSSWSMLAGTITVPFSEHVLPILQGAHSQSGGHRLPKNAMKRQASLCKHFKALFATQGKPRGQIQFQRLRNNLHLLMGGATESHCQRAMYTRRGRIGAIFAISHRKWLINLLSGSSPRPSTGFFLLV